jgi:phosphatidylinositol alpha-mannosyltransferase
MDRPGGVQRHIRDVAGALGEIGAQVTIIGPRIGDAPAQEPLAPNVELLRIGQAHRVRLSGTRFEASLALGAEQRRLRGVMRRGGFDVVHYHALWTPFLPMQAFACSPGPRVATFHDTPPDGLGGAVSRALLSGLSRWLLPKMDAAIAVSEAPRAHLRPAPGQAVWLEPPCTDLQRFLAAPAPHRVEGEPLTILFVGRLEPRKGVGLLLEAFRRLSQDGVGARLVIAGEGAEEPALRRYAAEHGLDDVVFAGRFEDADAPAIYAACDVVCAPSPYGESFGIVIAEAMASGKPVVAAANRGYRTLLTGPGAELLAAPGDAEGLYRRLKALALDPALRARLGAWGREEAARYDCRRLAPRLLDIYQHAIAAHAKAGRPAPRWSPSARPALGPEPAE